MFEICLYTPHICIIIKRQIRMGCLNCCKILLASGIKKIIYINDYKNDVIVSKLCYQLNVPIQKYGDNNSPEYNENILENKNTITNTITNF